MTIVISEVHYRKQSDAKRTIGEQKWRTAGHPKEEQNRQI